MSIDSMGGENRWTEQEILDNFDEVFSEAFPAPEPRENQKPVVEHAVRGIIEQDKDVVMVDAPPGFGKSITLYTILKILPGDSYYATPLKSLQDQLAEDDFIGDNLTQIQGRSNYPCVLPDADPDETVDVARCQRDSDFDCEIKGECPYYVQKSACVNSEISVMNFMYMMTVPMTPLPDDGQFSPRRHMTVDECQGVEDWGMNQISFTLSPFSVPTEVWASLDWPHEDKREDFNTMGAWVRDEVLPVSRNELDRLDAIRNKTEQQLNDEEKISNFVDRVERFLEDVEENHWVHTYEHVMRKNRSNYPKVEFKPIRVGRFLDSLVWNKADNLILSSATIPKGDFLKEIGLDDEDVLRMNIPSPFPVENRNIITDRAVGKMTASERESNMPDMAREIKAIAEEHEGQKGIVHCRGYNYIEMLKRECTNHNMGRWFRENCHIQDRDRREESLEEWINNDKQIFLSVNMAEGIDLKGEKCRWQVLLKTLYPHMGDERVRYRVNQLNDWEWYNGKAAIQIEQAYGRAVRSKDDWADFYILDKSAVGLIDRSSHLFHDWFLEGVEYEPDDNGGMCFGNKA